MKGYNDEFSNPSTYVNNGGGVRRLTENEAEFINLRPENKDLMKYLDNPVPHARPENKFLEEELAAHPLKQGFTDYLNEAPVVREHNNMLVSGGSLIGGSRIGGSLIGGKSGELKGGDFLGDVGKVASTVAPILPFLL